MRFNVAVVGATGAVGQTMLKVLAEQNFPINNLFLLASSRSAGKSVVFNQQSYTIQDLANFDFSQCDIGLFSAGGAISKVYAPKAAQAGCVVIDNTSYFRMHPDVPLVVPEVNPQAIDNYTQTNIIANPNCSTIQLMLALKPIDDAVEIERVWVSTYQSAGGAGQKGMDELAQQNAHLVKNPKAQVQSIPSAKFPLCLANNAIPQIGDFGEDGYSEEETKMHNETKKILNPQIELSATCVRIPVMLGHSEAVLVQTKRKISAVQTRELLAKTQGIEVVDDLSKSGSQAYPTAFSHGNGTNPVFVGRIREDIAFNNGISFWVVADSVRKGAALNAVQIAQKLIKNPQFLKRLPSRSQAVAL